MTRPTRTTSFVVWPRPTGTSFGRCGIRLVEGSITATRPATPLIEGDFVFLLGAMGNLHCVSLASGKVIWSKHLRRDFGDVKLTSWGCCSSPLIADGRLIVNPGAKDASLVALEPATGEVVWKTPGGPASFGSLILATFGGRQQLIGHDQNSLGGWDPANGERRGGSRRRVPATSMFRRRCKSRTS